MKRSAVGLATAALLFAGAGASQSPKTPPQMVFVKAATFVMGSTKKHAEPNESPEHEVRLRSFLIDRTEVTVGAYRACVDRTACKPPTIVSKDCSYDDGDDALPMNCVSFDEADRFCLAEEKRLPTEAEWELASQPDQAGAAFPWGPFKPNCLRAVSARGSHTEQLCAVSPRRVGSHPLGKSALGLFDMAGNVEEWVADFYDDRYVDLGPDDPKGPKVGTAHVLRGGSYLSKTPGLRVTARSWGSAEEHGPTVGFRCASSLVTP